MKHDLMYYIREEGQCNYFDIIDYFSELNQCSAEQKAKYLGDLIWFIHCRECDEKFKDKKEGKTASPNYKPEDVLEYLEYERANLLLIIEGKEDTEFNKGRLYAMDRMIKGAKMFTDKFHKQHEDDYKKMTDELF